MQYNIKLFSQFFIDKMGGGTSNQINQQQKKFTPSIKHGLLLVGSTSKGPLAINFQPNHIQSTKCFSRLTKYGQGVLFKQDIGFMTGGVEELQSTSVQLKQPDKQEYEGLISKKFLKININKVFSDPDNAFQNMPDMINARYGHCMVVLEGSIWVCGGREYGDDETGILSACERFDFGKEKWKSIPNLQYPRAGAGAVVYGEHIYIFGGYSGKGERTRVIESYHEGDSSWRKLPYHLHEGLEGFLLIQNPTNPASIFIFGGKNDDGKLNSVVQLNFDRSTVQHMNSMKQTRSFHQGYCHQNSVHIIGGGLQSIESYELSSEESERNRELSFLEHCSNKDMNSLTKIQWTITLKHKKKPYESPNYPFKAYIFGHSRQPFAKVLEMERLVVLSESQSLKHNFFKFPTISRVNKETCFVMGGINSEFTQVSDSVYSFNLLTEEIKYLQPLNMGKYGFAAVVKGSYLYVIGGRKLGGDEVAILGTCERFSFQTYKWEQIASLKHKRHSCLAVTVGDNLLVLGGYRGQGVRSNDIEMFIESENRWVEVEEKMELAAESMTSVTYEHSIYLFGGRAEQIDIQKVFRLNIEVDEGIKYEKSVTASLEPVGSLTAPGTNLKVFVNAKKGLAYVFGNIKHGIDIYSLKSHKIVQMQKLPVFENLMDEFFQSYTILF